VVAVSEVESKWLADFPGCLDVWVDFEQNGPPAQPLPPLDKVYAEQTGGAKILCKTEARLDAAHSQRRPTQLSPPIVSTQNSPLILFCQVTL
jgi:hypothetical protein